MKSRSTFAQGLAKAVFAGSLMLGLGLQTPAVAVPLETGFGGSANFGQIALNPNDDGSSSRLNLPFAVNFFGTTYNTFFVNNNGNITFNGPVGTFTPSPFPIAAQPMIAPFWADVDTRCRPGCGDVYVASPNSDTVVVTWNNVGYFSNHSFPTNNFQLILTNQANAPGGAAGDFNIAFRYDQLNWTTGDASGGSGGIGGTPAQAGFDAGDQVNFFTLPGSRTSAVTQLANTTNVAGGPGGLWSFAVRTGALPGTTASNPLMPVVSAAGWSFNFNVVLNQRVFIDPVIAVGYDYIVTSGPNIRTVLLPTGVGDDIYRLWLWDGTQWIDTGTDLVGGTIHDFGVGGVNRFRITGIETNAGLDPNNTSAFVTGLTFEGTGSVQMNMVPITFDTGTAAVPEPSALLIVLLGLAGLIAVRRRTA
jgi:Nidogen-like/PEP-CTERM motif